MLKMGAAPMLNLLFAFMQMQMQMRSWTLTLNDTIEMLYTHKKRDANANANANFDAHCEWALSLTLKNYEDILLLPMHHLLNLTKISLSCNTRVYFASSNMNPEERT